MAVICARCGTQNPDGNQFCQACGTPLAVAAATPGAGSAFPPPPAGALPGPPPFAPPPPGAPSPPGPPPPPGGYQSPYYAPSAVGPQPPVHRTPWVLIISAIVILVVIMAGAGIAIGVLSHRGTASQNTSGILPSPSPAGTPSPTSPPSTTGSSSASNSGESFTLPAGWTVRNNDEQTIVVTNPNGDGAVYIQSRALGTAQTAQQNKDNTDKYFQSQAPDTKTCPGSATTTGTLNGPSGIFWELCFTLTAGGQSFPARAALFAGANADGSVSYLVYLVTSDANMKSFIAEATPVLNSIHWKLT